MKISGTFIIRNLMFPKENENCGNFIKHEIVTRSKHGFSTDLHYTIYTPAELAADPTTLVAENDQRPADVADLPPVPTAAQLGIRIQELTIYAHDSTSCQIQGSISS